MTITIGALCDEGKSVILAADYLITFPAQAIILENAHKEKKITDNSMVLIAGVPTFTTFLDAAKQEASHEKRMQAIANIIAKHYGLFFREKITQQVLPYAGFGSFEDFQLKQASLHRDVIGELMKFIVAFNLQVDLILGGIDNDGSGHIFQISNPGASFCHDSPGFYCAGIGANRALPIFEFFSYSVDMKKEEALGIVYAAKKRTESLGGIGKETDAWLIDKSGISRANGSLIARLDETYEKHKSKYSSSIEAIEIKKEDTERLK